MPARKAKRKAAHSEVAKPYKPTPREQAALDAYRERREQRKPAPHIKDVGPGEITFDHADVGVAGHLLMEAIGTPDLEFLGGILNQLINAASKGGEVDEAGTNFMLSIVTGLEPKDQVETLLAVQMAAVHNATMTFARRLNNVDNIQQQDSAERAFNKLARTFAAQVGALKQYRTGGEQRMTVEHVTVKDGGQAIVGNVAAGGRGSREKIETTP